MNLNMREERHHIPHMCHADIYAVVYMRIIHLNGDFQLCIY
jgi:hypothetical protein